MKEIIVAGMILILAGCGPAIMADQTADPLPEGWYNPAKTEIQLSEDRDHCRAQCAAA